ncbi:MAG: flagellar export chaperone FliS [Spirochaetota bacterium]
MNGNPVNAYKQTTVKTANQGQIIVMLYDEAVKQLDYAKQLLDEGTKELDKVNNAIGKAQDILTELTVSLDFEQGGEMAQNLFSLYMFFNNQLTLANIEKDTKRLTQVRAFLRDLREAWAQISSKVGNTSGTAARGVNISF